MDEHKESKEAEIIGFPVIKVNYALMMHRPLFYPDNEIADQFAALMRRKSFTKAEIDLLRKMGFTVEVSTRPVEIPENFM